MRNHLIDTFCEIKFSTFSKVAVITPYKQQKNDLVRAIRAAHGDLVRATPGHFLAPV